MKRILSLLTLCIPLILQAQTWVSYSTANSQIPFDKVHCIATGAGTIWVGNNVSGSGNHLGGLTGSNWISGLPSTWLDDLSVDSAGNVWTVASGKLKKWDGATWTDYTSTLLGYWCFPVHADLKGNVWAVNQSNKKLVAFNGSSFSEVGSSQGLTSNNINEIVNYMGDIAIAFNDAGIAVFDGSAFTSYTSSNSALPADKVFDIAASGDTLWMVLENGYISYLYNGVVTNFQDTSLNTLAACITADHNGNVWLGTNGDGVVRYDGTSIVSYTSPTVPVLDSTNIILSIGVDVSNRICIGTRHHGLVIFDESGSTGANGPDRGDDGAVIYPNPASGFVTVTLPDGFTQDDMVELYTLHGSLISQLRTNDQKELRIDLEGLKKGSYVLRTRNAGSASSQLLIVY